MQWLQQLNESLQYIEDHLEGEISFQKAARIACCSTYHYQRMFTYIVGVPLSEYIRHRRLTKAAFDLQHGDKVLDVALRYGYESPTSFNRAFQNLHGITPSAAHKEDIQLKAYPRINFTITIKGETEMNYRIVTKEAFRVVGAGIQLPKDTDSNMQEIPKFWGKVNQEGLIPRLCTLINQEPAGVLGVCGCGDQDESWRYYIAVATDKAVPQGLEEYTVPACTWAIFPGSGSLPNAIQELQKKIVAEWLPTSGYEYADAPDIEVYLTAGPGPVDFEVWVPVTREA